MKKYVKVLTPLLITIIGSGLFIMFGKVKYNDLTLPPLAPKDFMFSIAWTIIYLILAYTMLDGYEKKGAYFLYLYVLVLHLIWNLFFFFIGSFVIGLIVLFLIILVSIVFVYYLAKEKKKYLYLNLFYLIWLIIATYLSIGIIILN